MIIDFLIETRNGWLVPWTGIKKTFILWNSVREAKRIRQRYYSESI